MTWDGFTRPFLTTWCTPCHSASVTGEDRRGAPEGTDFDTWEQAHAQADAILAWAGAEGAPMPPAGGVTAAEREALTRWVTCGAEGPASSPAPCDAPTPVAPDRVDCAEQAGVTVTGSLDASGPLPCVCSIDNDLVLTGSASLPALTSVGGDLRASGATIDELDLSTLVEVAGSVVVEGGALPPTFGPPRLERVGGELRLEGVARVATVDLPRLESVGSDLVLRDLPSLAALTHTSDLESIGGALRIVDAPALRVVDDLAYVDTIGGDVEVAGVTLDRLEALFSLRTIGGALTLHDLELTRLGGLTSLEQVGSLALYGVAGLTTVEAGGPAEIVGDARFAASPDLARLPLVSGLTRVGGDLVVDDLDALGALDELAALAEVGGSLELVGHAQLADLDGLYGVARVGGDLVIRDTPALTAAEIDALLSAWGVGVVEGAVDVP